jgi:antibiotic biosynthesis monooxygenase (ABM) superfamily enzyme
LIVTHAIVEKPWAAKSSTKAWEKAAEELSTKYPGFFTSGISGPQASAKFKMVLAATKERIESAAFRSGDDDESENDFVKTCEDAYS